MVMKLAQRLASGQTILTAWSSLATDAVVDVLALTPCDAVTLDMQHGAHDEASIHNGLASVAARGKGAVVRVPVGRNDMVSRALDFGAEAVIAPMINTAAEAQAFANAAKYPPLGERSWGPFRALDLHGIDDPKRYLREANATTMTFAMIETRAALGNIEAILETDGIDGVFVGPTDFSISWTEGADVDPHLPAMVEAVRSIARKAMAVRKAAGIFVFDPARAPAYVDMGYRFLAITNDIAFLKAGAAAGFASARKS